MMTPFSGLSLFLHLAIIGSAKVIGFFRRDMLSSVYNRGPQAASRTRKYLNRAVSVSIVVFISTVMLSFVGIAITTGVREGEAESHIEFIEGVVADVSKGRTFFYTREEVPQYVNTPKDTPKSAEETEKKTEEKPKPSNQEDTETAYPSLVISI